jgi:hypothetical protein
MSTSFSTYFPTAEHEEAPAHETESNSLPLEPLGFGLLTTPHELEYLTTSVFLNSPLSV